MEKIRFWGTEKMYPIESIQPVELHVLRIIYTEEVPEESSYEDGMVLYTSGDLEECTLMGWHTVYYQDDKTVYLSDDGSIWTEPEPQPEPEPEEPYEPTVEELRASKISEMESACSREENEGTDVELSDGSVEHFSLTLDSYVDIMLRQFKINSGASEVDYHADGEPSKYYSAEDMQTIINTAYDFIDYQETYCNELVLWIESLTDKDEIEAVWYGMEIPVEHRSEVLEKMLPVGDDETGMIPQDDNEPDEPDTDDSDDDTDDDTNIGAGGEIDVGDPADEGESADDFGGDD